MGHQEPPCLVPCHKSRHPPAHSVPSLRAPVFLKPCSAHSPASQTSWNKPRSIQDLYKTKQNKTTPRHQWETSTHKLARGILLCLLDRKTQHRRHRFSLGWSIYLMWFQEKIDWIFFPPQNYKSQLSSLYVIIGKNRKTRQKNNRVRHGLYH